MSNTRVTKAELKYLKDLKHKKYRDEEQKFLIEGFHLIEECLSSKYFSGNIEKIFMLPSIADKPGVQNLIQNSGKEKLHVLDENKFERITDTVNSQGIAALVRMNRGTPESEVFSDDDIIVALDGINDPGNLGTILRTCYWFNVTRIIVSKNSADLFNPKTLRSSQGSVFNLSIKTGADLSRDLEKLYEKKFDILLTVPDSGKSVRKAINQKLKKVIVFGNEANGISKELTLNSNYKRIMIQGNSMCESLNVSVAAGIIIYELAGRK